MCLNSSLGCGVSGRYIVNSLTRIRERGGRKRGEASGSVPASSDSQSMVGGGMVQPSPLVKKGEKKSSCFVKLETFFVLLQVQRDMWAQCPRLSYRVRYWAAMGVGGGSRWTDQMFVLFLQPCPFKNPTEVLGCCRKHVSLQ